MTEINNDQPINNNVIKIDSIVSSETRKPYVQLQWGENRAQFEPDKLRDHAMHLFEAAAAAEIDAILMKWALEKLNIKIEEAYKLVIIFREKRESGKIPKFNMVIGEDKMTAEEAKGGAKTLLFMATNNEMEAFLVDLIINDVGHDEEVANAMIAEIREMRGLTNFYFDDDDDED